MNLTFFWMLLVAVSFLAALSDLVYKVGSTSLKDKTSFTPLNYIQNITIIVSWILVLLAKLLVGIPYSSLDLSIAVPVNNLLTALFGSVMGVIFLKEKITSDLIKAYIFTILACFFLIVGDLI